MSMMTQPKTQAPRSSILPILLGVAILAGMLTAVTAWLINRSRSDGSTAPPAKPAPTFTLTSQSGKTISASDLKDKVWIADFVFTRCAGPCPKMTQTMADLTRQIKDSRVRFVSFDVDPAHDTPVILDTYAKNYDADESRWLLLTEPGTSYLDIAAGFGVMARPADDSHPIIHSEKFFLVDKSGNIHGVYSWADEQSMQDLVKDATSLAAE